MWYHAHFRLTYFNLINLIYYNSYWNIVPYVFFPDGSTAWLCLGLNAPPSPTANRAEFKWFNRPSAWSMWRSPFLSRSAIENSCRQEGWKRLPFMWLQQRWRFLQVNAYTHSHVDGAISHKKLKPLLVWVWYYFPPQVTLDKFIWPSTGGWSNAIWKAKKTRNRSQCCIRSGNTLWCDVLKQEYCDAIGFIHAINSNNLWINKVMCFCSTGNCTSKVVYHRCISGI